MKHRKLLVAAIGAAHLLTAGTALAGHDHGRRGRDPEPPVRYDYARVVSATPISELTEVSRPEQQCWDEHVQHRVRADSQPHLGGIILGGVVGGVVGNRFGGGDGKKAMTAVGTIVGAAVGNELAQDRRPERSYSRIEQRCETVRVSHTEERIIGYRVRYRYNGEEYVTRTDSDPGRRLRVRVAVTPAE